MFLAGWLCERINPYRTLALGLLVWSLATAATGLAQGFGALIVLRLLLGIGESAAFPASSALIGGHLDPARLGRANGMIGLGLSLGPAFGTFVGGLLIAGLGWRRVFIVFGLVSMLWLWPWLAHTRVLWAQADAPDRPGGPSYLAIMSHREAWGAALGHFAANYLFYFVLSWMPLYLVKARGYSVGQMAELGGIIYLAYAASIAFSGWVTDRAIAGGASINGTRKAAAVASHIVAPAGLMISALGDNTWAVAGLFIAGHGIRSQHRRRLRHRPDPGRPPRLGQIGEFPERRRKRRGHDRAGHHRPGGATPPGSSSGRSPSPPRSG